MNRIFPWQEQISQTTDIFYSSPYLHSYPIIEDCHSTSIFVRCATSVSEVLTALGITVNYTFKTNIRNKLQVPNYFLPALSQIKLQESTFTLIAFHPHQKALKGMH